MLNKFAYVEANFGISKFNQWRRMCDLWRTNKLLPNEYFDLRLYDHDSLDQRNYIGSIKAKEIWKKYNKTLTNKYIDNKWHFYHKFVDLPIPETSLLQFPYLKDQIKEIYDLSRSRPIILKSINPNGDKYPIIITDKVDYETIEAICSRNYALDYVYQQLLKPHVKLDRFTESGYIGRLTVITLVSEPNKLDIIGAYTRFTGKRNVVDYTTIKGNYLVGVNVDDWSMLYATKSYNLDTKSKTFLNEETVYGSSLPVGNDFDEELCRWVSEIHNKLDLTASLIGWDIAIANTGLWCLGATFKPNFTPLQKAEGKGYLHVFDPETVLPIGHTPIKSFVRQSSSHTWKPR